MIAARVDAEVQRFMSQLSQEELALARDYTTGNHWLTLWGVIVSAIITWVIVRSGILDKAYARLEERSRALRTFLVAALFAIISGILSLPLTIYQGWWRERQYDLSSQPLGDFLGQSAIGLAINAVMFGLLLLALYWVIRKAGRIWWLWSGGVIAAFFAGALLLSPVLIEPIFNDYQPIPEGEVRDGVLALAADAGVPADRVFVYDGSRQSDMFTANVSGVGSSARIAISDVALDEAPLDEVLAVTGHEIGHYILGQIWIMIAAFAILSVLAFFLLDRSYAWFARRFGSDAPLGDVRGVPVFMFVLGLLLVLGMPALNAVIRWGERSADAYSLEHVGLPDALSRALLKTAEYRYPLAGPVEEAIFYTHPTVENRIRTAMEWKLRREAAPN